jgi:hypothetical protein
MRASTAIMLVLVVLSAACHCAKADDVDTDGDADLESSGSSTSGTPATSSSTSESSTGDPFDASPWIGRYHYENPFLTFGVLFDPLPVETDRTLANFEIFDDSRARMSYDSCSFEEPIVINYIWEPDGADWLRLRPGASETSLRYMAGVNLDSLRVRRIEPAESCRPQLNFEYDGQLDLWSSFFPGESCWVDRCTAPKRFHVDYCEGEEPPPCP